MPWTVDRKTVKINAGWEPKDKNGKITPHQAKWNAFMEELRKGRSPKEAAERIGDSKYTILNKATGQAEIRVGGKHRVAFIQDDKAQTLTKIQLGGHT